MKRKESKVMEEELKKGFVKGITVHADEIIRGDLNHEYVCYEDFIDSLEDALYLLYLDYLEDKEREEYGKDFDKEEVERKFKNTWKEVKEEVLEDVLQNIKDMAIKEIEDELKDYKSIALFLGIQHLHTPYKYYPLYKLLSEEKIKDKKDAFKKLSEFVEEFADENRAECWIIVINEENYEELIEGDVEIAIAVLRRDYKEFTLTKEE